MIGKTTLTKTHKTMSKQNVIMGLIEYLIADGETSERTGGTAQVEAAGHLELSGQHLVVLDRGFVYVGEVSREGDFLIITNARNVRKWGTSKGLGELIAGPTPNTVLDPCGVVKVPFKALISLIACSGF
jgi:hypothetical protein